MRLRILIAVLLVAAAAGASVAYSYAAPKRYDATARVVVHPIPTGDDTYTGIDVLFDSPDQSRVIETAAHYFDTPEVVNKVATTLSLSPSTVRDSIDVHPLGGSNILVVVGKSRHPERAAQIANAIVQEGIQQETARFQAQVSAVLAKLRASPDLAAQKRINDLESVQSRPDPTLQTLSAATAPTSAAWPKPERIIPATTIAALVPAALILLLPPLFRRRREQPKVDKQREREFEEHERALTERSEALARRDQELAAREQELRAREQVPREEPKPAPPPPEAAHLEERIAAVTAREAAMARQGAELALRGRELEALAATLAERDAELERRELEPPPEPEPPPPAPGAPGEWRIEDLERLVAEHGSEHPDRIEEWRYYVHFLREHAGSDGTLPASFDYLIDETFAEIL